MNDTNVQMTIAGVTFDRVRYDAQADVLYLHVAGGPKLPPKLEAMRSRKFGSFHFPGDGDHRLVLA